MDNNFNDERVSNVEKNVIKTVYSILIVFLGASIIIQKLFLKAELNQYIFELIALVGALLLQYFGYSNNGIANPGEEKTNFIKIFTETFVNIIIMVLIMVFILSVDSKESITFGLIYGIVNFTLKIASSYLNARRNKKINEESEF